MQLDAASAESQSASRDARTGIINAIYDLYKPQPQPPVIKEEPCCSDELDRNQEYIADEDESEEKDKQLEAAAQIEVQVPKDMMLAHFCKLCDSPLSGSETARLHYAGRKHALKENQYVRKVYQEMGIDPTRFFSKPTGGEAPTVKRQKPSPEELDKFKYSCFLCSISFESYAQVESHVQSPEHTLKVQQYEERGKRGKPIWPKPNKEKKPIRSFFCNLCDKVMNSPDQYTAHVNSKKHKNKEANEEKYHELDLDAGHAVMKFCRPPVQHGGQGIFSIDISSDALRLATSGRAADNSGLIVLWDYAALLQSAVSCSAAEEFPGADKFMLCRLSNHTGCVNCVRWSRGGSLLASCADDQLVIIWHLVGSTSASASENVTPFQRAASGSSTAERERWRPQHMLRNGHLGDILQIEWSPNDRYLASCSVDNCIVVWDAQQLPQIVTTLRGHTGMVKGIAWDPLCLYLASQSTDKSIRIWSTQSWSCVRVIDKPFAEAGESTYFLRLHWSPDANTLVSAHCVNNGGPTAQLIERQGWAAQNDLVGHRKAVSCARWSPVIFQRKFGGKPTQRQCVVALGSKDHGISLWSTLYKRPIGTFSELFNNTVMDISWSHDGLCMAACSMDGHVALFVFKDGELGDAMAQSEYINFLIDNYGPVPGSILHSKYRLGNDNDTDLRNADDEPMQSLDLVADRQRGDKIAAALSVSSASNTTAAAVLTSPPPPIVSSAATVASQVITTSPDTVSTASTAMKQTEEKTADGRRRIRPLFLGSTIGSIAPTSVVSAPTEVPAQFSSESTANDDEMEEAIVEVEPEEGRQPTVVDIPRGAPQRKRQRSSSPQLPELNEDVGVVERRDQSSRASVDAFGVRLQPSKRRKSLTVDVQDKFSLRVHNAIDVAAGVKATRLECVPTRSSTATMAKWETYLDSDILSMTASEKYIAAVCVDETLSLLCAASGALLHSPLVLPSPLAAIVLSPGALHVMLLLTDATIFIFELPSLRATLHSVSISSLFVCAEGSSSRPKLRRALLSDDGVPTLSMSNGRQYVYDAIDSKTWIMQTDYCGPLARLCNVTAKRSSALRCDATAARGRTPVVRNCPKSVAKLATLCWLERQMHAAVGVSPEQYAKCLAQFVSYAVESGASARLKTLIETFLSDLKSGEPDQQRVAQLSKRNLVEKTILPLLARSSTMQQMYMAYKQELNEIW